MNHARKAAYDRLKDEKKTFRSVGSALLHRPRPDLRARDASKGAALFVAKTLRSLGAHCALHPPAKVGGTSATPLGLGSKNLALLSPRYERLFSAGFAFKQALSMRRYERFWKKGGLPQYQARGLGRWAGWRRLRRMRRSIKRALPRHSALARFLLLRRHSRRAIPRGRLTLKGYTGGRAYPVYGSFGRLKSGKVGPAFWVLGFRRALKRALFLRTWPESPALALPLALKGGLLLKGRLRLQRLLAPYIRSELTESQVAGRQASGISSPGLPGWLSRFFRYDASRWGRCYGVRELSHSRFGRRAGYLAEYSRPAVRYKKGGVISDSGWWLSRGEVRQLLRLGALRTSALYSPDGPRWSTSRLFSVRLCYLCWGVLRSGSYWVFKNVKNGSYWVFKKNLDYLGPDSVCGALSWALYGWSMAWVSGVVARALGLLGRCVGVAFFVVDTCIMVFVFFSITALLLLGPVLGLGLFHLILLAVLLRLWVSFLRWTSGGKGSA